MKKSTLVLIILSAAVILSGCIRGGSETGIKDAGGNRNGGAGESRSEEWNLGGQGLTALKTEMFENREQVARFVVSHNSLTGALPAEINKLKNVKEIDASYNSLTGIPAEIGQLPLLEKLDFSHNSIDTMPNEIANLGNLAVLNLAGNSFKEIPAPLLALKSLQELDLSGNKISAEELERARQALPATEIIFKAEEEACQDECGNGACQETVCMAVGCPCSETAANCPQDCKASNETASSAPSAGKPEEQGGRGSTGIANPASANCEQLGGRVEIRTAGDGSQTGYCVFPGGKECEEWALMREECLP